MSLEDKVRIAILSKYKSISLFCKKNDLKYSTVMSALERGFANSNFSTVTSISHALGMEAEYFTSEIKFDEAEKNRANQNDILEYVKSNPSIRMVAKIHGQLTEEGQKEILNHAQYVAAHKAKGIED